MILIIEDFNKLSSEEQRFILFHGSSNCERRIMKGIEEVKEIFMNMAFHDKFLDKECLDVIARFAGKKVLVSNDGYNIFICGDDNYVFKEEMFN